MAGRISAALLAAVAAFLFSGVLPAQVNLTPEELAIARSLSPAERQQALELLRSGQLDDLRRQFRQSQGQARPQAGSSVASELPLQLPTGLFGDDDEEPEEPRVVGADTLVVVTKLRAGLEPEEIEDFERDRYRSQLLGRRTVQLNKRGVLEIPGVASIPLNGLSADEVALRLEAEPMLQELEIEVTILPLTPIGIEALEPYGYALFEEEEEYLPFLVPDEGAVLPVPRDYVIGPGDVLTLQYYGEENLTQQLYVNDDGTINLDRMGPQSVAGLTLGEVKAEIERRVAEQMIGTRAAVTLTELRSVPVFVVGEVRKPGGYTVSALSRMTSALFKGGGVTEIGSLRKVQLKRDGRTVQTLDLYELLLQGNTAADVQLKAGDVVFVPIVDRVAGIDGAVRRPAQYEISGERTVGELVALAGGLTPDADRRNVQLERIDDSGVRSVESLDLTAGGQQTLLRPGDLVRIYPVIEELGDAVYLDGHVFRPGSYEWSPGLRLTDLLPSDAYLRPKADMNYVLIRRETGADRQVTVLSADLAAARAAPGSEADPLLENRDTVTVFQLGVTRTFAVEKILGELENQATSDRPMQMVRIGGNVRAPGRYPLERNMRVSDLLRAGGGLDPSAFEAEAELTRYRIGPDGRRTTELDSVDLAAVLAGNPVADLTLKPYDFLSIKEIPRWKDQIEVELGGEVRFPGVYPARSGEMLSSVIERAGGLTDRAFPAGSVFTRETLQAREAQQIEELTDRLEVDLASLALKAANSPGGRSEQAYNVGQSLIQKLRSTQPVGRLVIDLPELLAKPGNLDYDIVLRDGDRLLVPAEAQEVTVLGEVQYPTSHRYARTLKRDGYIDLSGGLSSNADRKRIYVVRANGAVVTGSGSVWFGRGRGRQIRPGDTIVVPLDTDRLPTLTQWTSITQTIVNLAIAVAAVNSF